MKQNGPHIVVDGLYGIQSYGDDAMLLSLICNMKLRIPKVRFTVLSRHPKRLTSLYGIKAIQNLDHPEWVKERGYWFYGFNDNQPRGHIDIIRDTIAQADLLIIGGGNLLLDITDDWLRGPIAWHWFSSEIARIYKVPYMLYACSLGPFRTAWGMARSAYIVREAVAVTVRERYSLLLAEEMRKDCNTFLLPDPALMLTPDETGGEKILKESGFSHDYDGVTIGVSVRDLSWMLDAVGVASYIKGVQDLCDTLIDQYDAQIVFIPQCSYDFGSKEEDDRNIAQQVIEGICRKERCISLTGQYRVDEIMGVYKYMDAVIATRLHAAVFSAIARTPFIAFEYLPKTIGFLQNIGLEQYAVPLCALYDRGYVARRFHDVLRDRLTIIEKLDIEVRNAIKSASKYFDIIESIVASVE